MKKTNPQISIIVPVYNVEKYLEACLDSLLAQTFGNIEILCINDGSADKSLAILCRYEKEHPKLRVFNQANAGPAKARNVGLENARGEYIMFCDADDTYEPQMCEKMLAAITDNDVDLVMCNTNAYDKQGANAWNKYYFPINEGISLLTPEINLKTNVFLWNKIFKKSKIDAFQIRFPNGHKADDNYFIFAYLAVSEKIYCLNQYLYNHFERENSIMDLYNNSGIKYCDVQDKIDILEILYFFMKRHNIFANNIEYFQKILYNELFHAWINVSEEWKGLFLSRCAEVLSQINLPQWNDDVVINVLLKKIQNKEFYEAANTLDLMVEQNFSRRKYITQPDLLPTFSRNNISIVFNCDENYAKYLSVTIQSIIQHASPEKNYDLIVLNLDISSDTQEKLQSMILNHKNFSIRFYNMENYVKTYQVDKLVTFRHIKSAAYYRIFIIDLLKNYDKAIYLDADLIVNTDIAKLYEINLENHAIAAVRDIYISQITPENEFVFSGFYQYAQKFLNISNLNNYFNSGVMLINIKKAGTKEYWNKLIAKAKENSSLLVDQDVLNSIFYKDVKLLDTNWNTQLNFGAKTLSSLYTKETKEIKIFHFCSEYKPWLDTTLKYSYLWWNYARMTPFYEEILFKNLKSQSFNTIELTFVRETANYLKNKIRYWRYRLLSQITFGKKRRKYKQKRKELKARLKQVRAFLKGK